MSNFSDRYVNLMLSQVRDEINYLVDNGHDQTHPPTQCMFCFKNGYGELKCGRLSQLRQFEKTLQDHRPERFEKTRKPFGLPIQPENENVQSIQVVDEKPIFQLKF